MTKQKSTKRALLLSALSLLMCVSMLVGSTFAWFTDSVTSGRNIIQSGNLDAKLSFSTWDEATNTWGDYQEVTSDTIVFGKDAKYEPGYTEVVKFKVENLGSLAFKYQLGMHVFDETPSTNVYGDEFYLSDYIKVGTMDAEVDGWSVDRASAAEYATMNINDAKNLALVPNPLGGYFTTWLYPAGTFDNGVAQDVDEWAFVIHMPTTVGNEANHKSDVEAPSIEFAVNLLATQYTYESDSFDNQYDADAEYPAIPDKWDGTADFSLFGLNRNPAPEDLDPSKVSLNENTYVISTAEELAAFAKLVDAGNTFEGKRIVLVSDLDLYVKDANGEPISFDPIGSYRKDKIFEGTFDGQNHTIANMSQNTWALDNGYYYGDLGLGLFGAVENATIKNLVMDNASISGESALCGTIAAVAGDNVIFENIKVINSEVADYQYYAGGIVGWAGGDEQFINCIIDASTTIGAQWGEFNNANGGVIGGVSTSADILIKDCTIACRIDAYNDVTSAYEWYSYRRSGMLIGDSGRVDDPDGDNVGNAIAPNLTCENVTVIYGDWANYHYCQFKNMNYPWVRVEAGTSNSAYSNPRYGHPTDANGNKVVDENHTHNDGEKHNELIVFDQLYGGETGDRYCTYGTATHDGVTIIYNNK